MESCLMMALLARGQEVPLTRLPVYAPCESMPITGFTFPCFVFCEQKNYQQNFIGKSNTYLCNCPFEHHFVSLEDMQSDISF